MGYNTILCFIGAAGPQVSEQRVAMLALRELPNVWVFDNNDLRAPYRLVAVVENGRMVKLQRPVPRWLKPLLP